ncbi:MAG: N-acetylmuramoyl-L-alanine amidase [Gammaproteobacteria bacterium]|nr:N-acetylmuramoyl-L-alanine amidase [Gammaproteobacteria bacterium]
MRFAWGLVLFLLSQSLWADVQVNNVRIWAAPDSTRVVFDITAPVKHQVSLLTDPYRLVVDIENTALNRQITQPGAQDRYLQRVRGSGREGNDLRVVLDLKKFSRTRSFLLEPNNQYGHRLVIDIFDTEAEEQARVEAIEAESFDKNKRDVVIAIDAGHGGDDPGASGPKGTFEKNVTLQMAKVLARLVEQERGMRAVLIREGDYFMQLRQRIEKARRYKADLFISIHADAFRDSRVYGSSVYVLSAAGSSSEHAKWLAERENAADLIGGVTLEDKDDVLKSVLLDLSQTASLEASIDIAEKVLNGIKQVGKLHKPRVEAAGFAVLKSPDIPSVLIETAYISNPRDESNLRSPVHQQKLANAILRGIKTYFSEHAPDGSLLASRQHVIVPGESLSTIAQQYRVSLKSLRDVNRLRSDIVQAGEVLTIPNGHDG